MARLTLAQQIALLDDPAPQDFDPEDAFRRPPDAERAEDEPEPELDGREHYVDVGRSALRGLDPLLSQPKYTGVRASRVKIFDDDPDFSDEDDGSPAAVDEDEDDSEGEEKDDDDLPDTNPIVDDEANARPARMSFSQDEEFTGFGSDANDQDEDGDMDDNEETHPNLPVRPSIPLPSAHHPLDSPSPSPPPPPLPTSDNLKGLAVTRQLATYDALLSTRIALQKSLARSNLLPLPGVVRKYADHPDAADVMRRFWKEAEGMNDELFELREGLLKLNEKLDTLPERPLKRKRASTSRAEPSSDSDSESDSDFTNLVASATHHHALLSAAAHPTTLLTLSKWSSKILAVHPSLLSSHPTSTTRFSAHRNQPPKGVVAVIDEALVEGREKLLRRTRGRRGGEGRMGADGDADEEGEDVEVFDDADFYGALLRDVIESRRGGIAPETLLPNRKPKQSKKKVDTKASKGRKLRFETHEKMRHFMAPAQAGGRWSEAQVDELFASLLAGGGEAEVEVEVDGRGVNGVNGVGQLRVFG